MTESKKPAAILVTPVLPHPAHSGRSIRAWGWLTELAMDHDVHVLVANQLPDEFTLSEGHPASSVTSVAAAVRTPNRALKLAGLVFPPLVLASRRLVSEWRHPIANLLPEIASARDVRKIVVFRVYLHDVARSLFARHSTAARILDMDDLESQTRASVALALFAAGRLTVALRLLASSLQYRLVEARLADTYDTVLLASPADVDTLHRRVRRTVRHRPNWVPDPGARALRPMNGPLSLLFVGSLDYYPNEAAARFIATRIVPKLRKRLDRAFHVAIAGRHPSAALLHLLAKHPEVQVYPDADDLTPLYERSDIVLVPLTSGGGTKIKVLEAFAHCRPVISTHEGVSGLSVQPKEQYLAANSPGEFVSTIVQLANGTADVAAVAMAGRRYYESSGAWPSET